MAASFHPSSSKPVIAVAGATGDLGTRLTDTFLSPELHGRLSGFVAFARKETASTARWKSLGAEVRLIGDDSSMEDVVKALENVDVLLNAISTAGADLRDKLAKALPRTSVKLYFPSEFGVDHTLHDFNIPEWDGKKRHYDLTKQITKGTDIQVCRMFVALFLHSGVGPDYGFRGAEGIYEAVGSLDQSMSYTDISDIARVLCRLAGKAMQGQKVPERLRIAGTHTTFREVAQIMSESGTSEIELKSVDLDKYRRTALSRPYKDRDAVECLRFIMGDGRDDYRPTSEGGHGNDNEVKIGSRDERHAVVSTGD